MDTQNENFTPPRHWIGPEELDANYWRDPKTHERRAQEFHDKPIETIAMIDKLDTQGIARRDFLTIMGASMAMASFACARRPVHKIIPYVVKPEEITPGVANWYASTCQECSSGCGVLVKTREGRPIKLEGNPDHPINRGALCARGQASVLNLYDPDRLTAPVAISRAQGERRSMTWAEVDSVIQSHLKKASGGANRVRILSETMNGESTRRLVQEFLSAFNGGTHVEYDPLSLEEIAEAQAESYGTPLVPQYRFDQAELVVSLGADFLGNWISPVEHAADWVKKRKLQESNFAQAHMSKLICFEPTLSITGANSDERHPIRPGDELKVALAIAYEIIVGQRNSRFANDLSVVSMLSGYKPENVAADIGIEAGAAKLRKIAHELWQNRGKSLIVGGSVPSKSLNARALQLVINLLNSALENEGVTVNGTAHPSLYRSSGFAGVSKLIQDLNHGAVDVLIIYRSNPVYTLPKRAGFEQALKRVPLVITVTDRVDETAQLTDFVLPDHHYLENWGDAQLRKGLFSLQQPTIAPIHSSRGFQDSLLTWIRGAQVKAASLATRTDSWHDYLKANWKETVYKNYKIAAPFEQFWEKSLQDGVFNGMATSQVKASTARPFRTTSISLLPKFTPTSQGLSLALYGNHFIYDGKSANNAWLQEMPDPISSVTWDNYLGMSPVLAKKLGVTAEEVVEVSSTGTGISAELPVYIQPGLHPSVVSAAVGYGRRSAGKVGNQTGVDMYPFVQSENGHLIFSGQSVSIKKTGKFYKLASTQWHTATEDRPVINDITLAAYRKNPEAALHTDPHLRLETVPTMWPVHEYKGYRWGMAIDLNACTGCGACMVACQAENNVPVVGRDQVRVSRQMHWLRIDRYYSGTPENPDLVFQPMLCQHCENAPCETVCPVLATVHSPEGLNEQVYNRCVGTRYCQNNCPYKVRRFNFFDHWKSYEGTMNLAWNPEVTVRSRGIMEKCTFCVQRISDAKDRAKDAGEKIKDGTLKTACQQTCPTEAIVFGDINDPNSHVSQIRSKPRAFRVLENLNAKPSISYLTKVRNKEGSAHEI